MPGPCLTLWGNHKTVFHGAAAHYAPPQKCMSVPISSHTRQHLFSFFFFYYYYSHPSGCKFGIRDLIFPNPLLGFALAYAILILFLPIFVHFIYALSDLIAITYYKLPWWPLFSMLQVIGIRMLTTSPDVNVSPVWSLFFPRFLGKSSWEQYSQSFCMTI